MPGTRQHKAGHDGLAAGCGHFASPVAQRRGGRNRDLPFVRRGGILLQRGNAICVASPPPSLGVSSLDLGRLHPRAALFLPAFWLPTVSRPSGPWDRPPAAAWADTITMPPPACCY